MDNVLRTAGTVVITLLVSWPSLVIGYVVAAVVSGFKAGDFLYTLHEEAAVRKFSSREERTYSNVEQAEGPKE